MISKLRSVDVGTSLVVQWLGLRASTAGGAVMIPGQGTKIPHAASHNQKKKNKNKTGCKQRQTLIFHGWPCRPLQSVPFLLQPRSRRLGRSVLGLSCRFKRKMFFSQSFCFVNIRPTLLWPSWMAQW